MCRESCGCCCAPEGLEKFDREKALAGREVVTRDGSRVLKLMYVPEADFSQEIIAVIEGQDNPTRHNRDDGEYYDCDGDRGDNDLDLFFKAEAKQRPFDLDKITAGAKVVNLRGDIVKYINVEGGCVTDRKQVNLKVRFEDGEEWNYTATGLFRGREDDLTHYHHLRILS